MDLSTAAELKTVLVGAPLPATRSDLLQYAVRQHAESPLLDGLRSLSSGRTYRSLDEVAEELQQVQPNRGQPVPHQPKEEAGLPPGGDAYTEQHPESGAVRS